MRDCSNFIYAKVRNTLVNASYEWSGYSVTVVVILDNRSKEKKRLKLAFGFKQINFNILVAKIEQDESHI